MLYLPAACALLAFSQPTAPIAPGATPGAPAPAAAKGPSGVDKLQMESRNLLEVLTSPLARAFAAEAVNLPPAEPRTLYQDPATKKWFTPSQAAQLPEAQRSALKPRVLDEEFYYTTRYGTPLAYSRVFELLSSSGAWNGGSDLRGKRVLDFGCGGIGPMRLMAMLGADAVGVDVDAMLGALYSGRADQGPIGAKGGRSTYITGRWPAEAETIAAVGGGFDLIISKNTLKNGYLHPARPVDPRMLVDLGVKEDAFVSALHHALKPGGIVLIYNICPAPSKPEEPYRPWTDGRCPFTRDQWAAAGFEVLVFDRSDDQATRQMAKALGWDAEGMDLQGDLFAHWTLVRRPAGSANR